MNDTTPNAVNTRRIPYSDDYDRDDYDRDDYDRDDYDRDDYDRDLGGTSPDQPPSPRDCAQFHELSGGALTGGTLKKFLWASYDAKPPTRITTETGIYLLDRKLSTANVKVYHNPLTGFAVVVHRGTLGVKDWSNNLMFGLTGITGYKMTPRFKHAEHAQRAAEKTYGREHLTTIGHSQGGLLAELVGRKGFEVITYNAPARNGNTKFNVNQFNVRHPHDPLSVYTTGLKPLRKSRHEVLLRAPNVSLLKNHGLDMLDYERTKLFGRPFPRKRSKSATRARSSRATSLRSRNRNLTKSRRRV
jgi:hypothetical protein